MHITIMKIYNYFNRVKGVRIPLTEIYNNVLFTEDKKDILIWKLKYPQPPLKDILEASDEVPEETQTFRANLNLEEFLGQYIETLKLAEKNNKLSFSESLMLSYFKEKRMIN